MVTALELIVGHVACKPYRYCKREDNAVLHTAQCTKDINDLKYSFFLNPVYCVSMCVCSCRKSFRLLMTGHERFMCPFADTRLAPLFLTKHIPPVQIPLLQRSPHDNKSLPVSTYIKSTKVLQTQWTKYKSLMYF